jgi:hypothetical protein
MLKEMEKCDSLSSDSALQKDCFEKVKSVCRLRAGIGRADWGVKRGDDSYAPDDGLIDLLRLLHKTSYLQTQGSEGDLLGCIAAYGQQGNAPLRVLLLMIEYLTNRHIKISDVQESYPVVHDAKMQVCE